MTILLEVNDLTVKFNTRFGEVTALASVGITVRPGEIHGLVGESGAGKTTVGEAITGLIRDPGYIANGEILFDGTDLRQLSTAAYHRLRGGRISMIMQDPQTSLNPLLTIGDQLVETIRQHSTQSREQARESAVALLKETGIDRADERIDQYPHQFSGGMRQRVVIALALCTNPDLIVADEPTTALDVSVQKQILQLIRTLCSSRNLGLILITHDIGVISEITDRVTVLRHGRVIESGATPRVLGSSSHPYIRSLIAAVPPLDRRLDRFDSPLVDETSPKSEPWRIPGAGASVASDWLLASDPEQRARSTDDHMSAPSPILEIENLAVTYDAGQSHWWRQGEGFHALSGINLKLFQGEVLGVVGESGSGKSTLAKTIVGLVDPSAGSITFDGRSLPYGSKRGRRHEVRRKIQMVFQDPYSSLNNRHTVERIIAEPIRFYGLSRDRQHIRKLVASLLDLVELPQQAMLRYPHQFSGGQRQRISIARALVSRPQFLICDEPTSALDVSIQAQVLNLLKDLQQAFGLTILFITHNLGVIRQMADRIVVLRNGVLLETAATEAFFNAPSDPYSRQLLAETPSLSGIKTIR